MHFLWQLEKLLTDLSDQLAPACSDYLPLETIVRSVLTLVYPHGNSGFSLDERNLPVPAICQGGADDIIDGDDIAFVDSSSGIAERGLKNFIIGHTAHTGTPIFICDNHNYVLEAWQLLREQQSTLVHIDQHRDDAPATQFETLYHTRICDYIDFAIRNKWIAEQVISIIEQHDLPQLQSMPDHNRICNIDLDIFAPECTILSLADKVKAIIAAADNCSLITLATSPGFIAQPRAIEIAKLLWKYL
ncbi:MAG: hypothetical protein L3J71_16985 [Victivallaceae bacterium]|nr:hypothetical protein [Victivallaceae bacterium]